jgi:hypothetical protein
MVKASVLNVGWRTGQGVNSSWSCSACNADARTTSYLNRTSLWQSEHFPSTTLDYSRYFENTAKSVEWTTAIAYQQIILLCSYPNLLERPFLKNPWTPIDENEHGCFKILNKKLVDCGVMKYSSTTKGCLLPSHLSRHHSMWLRYKSHIQTRPSSHSYVLWRYGDDRSFVC